jgi:hypothetical protein
VEADVGLSATLQPQADALAGAAAACALMVRTRRFAQSVHIDAPPGCRVDDQYFHLAPGAGRTVRLWLPPSPAGRQPIRVSALNAAAVCRAVGGTAAAQLDDDYGAARRQSGAR